LNHTTSENYLTLPGVSPGECLRILKIELLKGH
jgi:hypothetical protein